MDKLHTLALDKNLLTSIPTSAFLGAGKGLKRLDLSSNVITFIAQQAFWTVTELEYLNLYGNRIKAVPADLLAGMPPLFLDVSFHHSNALYSCISC